MLRRILHLEIGAERLTHFRIRYNMTQPIRGFMRHTQGAMPSQAEYPSRVVDAEQTRRQYGARVDDILPWLWRDDPIADEVAVLLRNQPSASKILYRVLEQGRGEDETLPPAIEELISDIEHVPAWVDWEVVNRAGALFFRTGLAGGIVLGAKSLCYGYCSPGGNKPLIMTGRLSGKAMNIRLAETSRYVVETCRAGGLERFGGGLLIAVRVRIMHAVVRDLLRQSDSWNDEQWGVPISQHDMLGTALLFSQSFVEGIRQFGFSVSKQEAEDYLHLWRYATRIMGLDESLFPTSEADALISADIILRTQGQPDSDARTLVDALVRAPLRRVADGTLSARRAEAQMAAGYGFCRSLLGPELADGLDLPKNGWRFVVPVVSKVVAACETLRKRLPAVDTRLTRAGERHWERAIEQGSDGRPSRFSPPTRLVT